jgi:hypothetical protein
MVGNYLVCMGIAFYFFIAGAVYQALFEHNLLVNNTMSRYFVSLLWFPMVILYGAYKIGVLINDKLKLSK